MATTTRLKANSIYGFGLGVIHAAAVFHLYLVLVLSLEIYTVFVCICNTPYFSPILYTNFMIVFSSVYI